MATVKESMELAECIAEYREPFDVWAFPCGLVMTDALAKWGDDEVDDSAVKAAAGAHAEHHRCHGGPLEAITIVRHEDDLDGIWHEAVCVHERKRNILSWGE